MIKTMQVTGSWARYVGFILTPAERLEAVLKINQRLRKMQDSGNLDAAIKLAQRRRLTQGHVTTVHSISRNKREGKYHGTFQGWHYRGHQW